MILFATSKVVSMTALMSLIYLLAGCVEERHVPEPSGPELTVEERYGAELERGLRLEASLHRDSPEATSLQIARLTLETTPASPDACRKLEAAMSDAAFEVTRPDNPRLMTSVSPEVAPLANRLELGLAVLQAKADAPPRDRVLARLFEKPPTMGITRIMQQGEQVSVHTLALVSSSMGNQVSWGALKGSREADQVILEGTRSMLGSAVTERVQFKVQGLEAQP